MCEKPQTSKQISIPQEIINQFIDHLHNNQGALKCALVCCAWIPSSCYHLFSKVNIWAFKYDQVFDLIGHVNHPLCTFALSVHKLVISTSTDDRHLMPINLSSNWVYPLIPYLAKLMSIKTLFVYRIGKWAFGWEPLSLLKSLIFPCSLPSS